MLLLAVLMLAAVPQKAWAQSPSGNWEDEGNRAATVPQSEDGSTLYISTAEELACYAYGVNHDWETTGTASGYWCGRTVELLADIDLSAHYWKPIGINRYFYFNGFFHGNGHVITGMTVNGDPQSDNTSYLPGYGLFGYMKGRSAGNGTPCITDLVLKDFSVTTIYSGNTMHVFYVGGLLGKCEAGAISNCLLVNGSVSRPFNNDHAYAGGLVAYGTPNECSNNYRYNVSASDGATDYYGPISGESVARCATLTVSGHGSVALSGSVGVMSEGKIYAANGQTVTLSGTPEAGYMVGYTASDVTITDGAFTMPASDDATITATFAPDPAHFSQSGDEYTIHTAEGWNVFCDLLAENDKSYFTGKTIVLGANIEVTRMAGGSYHDFTGTFDGGGYTLTVNYENTNNNVYTAPFSYVDGATIQNLIVGGTITGTSYRAAGIIGETGSTLSHIINCVSSVDISSDRYTAGFSGGGHVDIEGCVFNGKIDGTNMSGGFIGYSNGAQVIKNSLFAPQDGSSISGGTFYYNGGGDVTPVNCYYTRVLGTPQGKQALTHEAVSAVGEPIATYNVSGISIYGNGMQYGSTFYYDPERNFLRTVEGHNNEDGGWVFIASPLAAESIAPSEVQNLFPSAGATSNDYDLYRFNQSDPNGNEWQNWKATTSENHPDFTELVNGQGYLYATKEDRTLVFAGEYTAGTEPVEVPLVYDESAEFAGWNLVGNPFAVPATVNMNYYKMNDDGTAIEPVNITQPHDPIAVGTGIMVQANGANESVTFGNPTRTADNHGGLRVALHSGAEVIDNAIVSFNEGSKLGKFYFGEQDANIYIQQGSEEYAIVSVGRDVARNVSTEIPVNFNAKENGTYTLTVNPDNVELAYLHLIDNMTGADVDLLAVKVPELVEGPTINDGVSTGSTTSYTFEAKTTDYESRFKLVFSAIEDDDGDDDAPFAFVSNGEIIINDADAGNATLQVIDVTGRVVRAVGLSQCGSRTTTTGMAPGVYVLRLINGDDVRTQKIVIE